MPDFPRFNDLHRIARDEALIRNSKLSREVVEREGTDANVLTAGSAAVGDEVINQLAIVAAGVYLDSAKGEALDRLCFDRYQLFRKPAAASVGTVSFTTASANPATFNILENVVLSTADGIQFITTASAVFASGLTVGPTIAVRSVLAGAGQRAKIGTITSIVSSIPGSPANLAATNAAATAGDDDAEDDKSLRNRAKNFFSTARRGTLGAIEQGALAVPGVRRASVFEALDNNGRPAKVVLLVVADSYTDTLAQLDTTPATYQAQSQALAATVYDALSDVRAGGIYVLVQVASVVLQAVDLSLKFQAGADPDAVALQARATVVNYTNGLSPGASFDVLTVLAGIRAIPGLLYTGQEIRSPVGDIVPKPLQVIRTTLALVTASSSQSNKPITQTANPDLIVTV